MDTTKRPPAITRAINLAPALAALLALGFVLLAGARSGDAQGAGAPLALDQRIALPGVAGRIDHLALDVRGKRLFVAELGAGSVEAADLQNRRVLGRIRGLREPQGLAYLPARDELVVATGGDGDVAFYRARDLSQIGRLRVGDDADNVRVDPASGLVVVGFGGGALAFIDPARLSLVRTARLPAHPEAFQFDRGRAVVNLPNADETAVVDAASGRTIASWPDKVAHFNFPMAVDPASGVIVTAYRLPARLALLDPASGKPLQALPTCGDADDVWLDPGRRRIYVICGAGFVDVFAMSGGRYLHEARVPTRRGARTGLYDPTLDRLFVALPVHGAEPAAIWTFRPQSDRPKAPPAH